MDRCLDSRNAWPLGFNSNRCRRPDGRNEDRPGVDCRTANASEGRASGAPLISRTELVALVAAVLLCIPALAFAQIKGTPWKGEVKISHYSPQESPDATRLKASRTTSKVNVEPSPYIMSPEAVAAKARANRGEARPTGKRVATEWSGPVGTTSQRQPKGVSRQALALTEHPPTIMSPGTAITGQHYSTTNCEIFPNSCADPPDSSVAVGPSEVAIATNGALSVFSRTGTLNRNTRITTFFTNAIAVGETKVFDPHLLYDPYIGRFWFVVAARNDTSLSHLLVSISDTDLASGSWTIYRLDASQNGQQWCDYPQVGIDAQAVYLTCNMINWPQTPPDVRPGPMLRVFPKDPFVNGTSASGWRFLPSDLAVGNDPSHTVVPAIMYNASPGDGEFLIDAHGGGAAGNALEVWHLTDPNSPTGPTLDHVTQTVGSFDMAPDARQPGTNIGIDTGDTRLQFAFWRNGVLSTGQTVAGPTGNSAAAAFTEIDVSAFPSLPGTPLSDWVWTIPGDTNYDYDTYCPAVAVDLVTGHRAMVFNESSSGFTVYASGGVLGIPPSSVCTDCWESVSVPLLNVWQGYYTFDLGRNLDPKGRNRWGDFSGAASDPFGGVWLHAEYVYLQDVWGTKVQQFNFLATDAQWNPASLAFDPQVGLDPSAPQPVTLTNTGVYGLFIEKANAGEGFSQTNDCPVSPDALPPGASCTFNVSFAPTTPGQAQGSLNVISNVNGGQSGVALSGTSEDFLLDAPVPNSAAVIAGGTASYNLSVSPAGALTGTVALACTGAPQRSTCSVSPDSVSLDGSSTSTVTVSVSTAAPTMGGPRGPVVPPVRRPPLGLLLLGCLLALLILQTRAAVSDRQPQTLKPIATLVLAMVLLLTLGWTSCGGGGGGGGGGSTQHNPGTPPGTYNLVVTGTMTAGSTVLTHDVTLTLTVN